MSHAENILLILAREERKREIRLQAKQSIAPILNRTADNLEKSEILLQQLTKAKVVRV